MDTLQTHTKRQHTQASPLMQDLRPIGRSGISVTPLGIGGAYLGMNGDQQYDDDLAIATVIRGLELGINLIDTSPKYDESERRIGLALEAWRAQGGRREELVLQTKTGTRTWPYDYSYDGTMRSVEQSLDLLRTDYLDIVLIHDPNELEPVLAPDGALTALQDLKTQGVIRAIGLGCRPHAFHQRCIAAGVLDVSLTFRDYNLLYQTAREGVLAPAAEAGVAVFNASVTLTGLLSNRDPSAMVNNPALPRWVRNPHPDDLTRARALWQWCAAREVSLLALNLQYSLREPRITSTLLGFANPTEVEEDIAAAAVSIPDAVWAELSADFGL